MNQQDKAVAEAVLRHLCVRGWVCGIRFLEDHHYMLIEEPIDRDPITGQVSLSLPSRWQVCPAGQPLPSREDVESLSMQRQLKILCDLRLKPISGVRLGEECPDLVMEFASGETLFVVGCGDQNYEPWRVVVGFSKEHWEVTAGTTALYVWAPREFKDSLRAD
jgi:hypothetical protein